MKMVNMHHMKDKVYISFALQSNEWPDERQWPLGIWDYVYSKTTSSHLCSKCIKVPLRSDEKEFWNYQSAKLLSDSLLSMATYVHQLATRSVGANIC